MSYLIPLLIIIVVLFVGYKKVKATNIKITKWTAILFSLWLYFMLLATEEYAFAPLNRWVTNNIIDSRIFWIVFGLWGIFYFGKKLGFDKIVGGF